ncbi:zinc finger protein PLAGL1 isoform X2 [Ornithorhynchus anatinus]|nr:zinc finger protein PLAGL1 isoform X2 [Ornithorhynchus anatinus]
MATHLPQKSHRCAHCEKTFHRKDHLKNHLQTHDPNKMAFGCEECGKKYNTKLGYKRHLALHGANSGDLTCQVCALELGSTELLLDHLRAHARGKPPGADKERKHQCDHCERRFYTRKDVRRHLVVHTGCKDFLCQFCSQRFGRKDHLTRHTKKTHPHELLKEEQLPDGDLLDLFQPRSPGLQLKDEAATPAPFPLGAVGLNVMESGLRAEVSNPPKGVCEQSLQPAPPPPPLRTGSLGPLAALYPTSSPLLLPPSQTPQDQKYEPISTSDTPFSLLKSLPLKADTKTCGTMSLLEELPWQDPHPLPKFNPGLDQVAGVPGRLPLPTEMMALADALSLAAPAASLDLAHILSFWQLPPADAQSAIGDTTMALGQGDALPARLTYLGQQQPEAPLAMGSGTYSQFNLPHILHSFASGASSTTLPHFHHAFK